MSKARSNSASGLAAKLPGTMGRPKPSGAGSFGTSVRDKQSELEAQEKAAKKRLAGTMPQPPKPPKPEVSKPSVREQQQNKIDSMAKTVEA